MRLVRQNDWGNIYYAPKGKSLTKSGSADTKLGIPLKEKQRIKVTWPDGEQETLTLKSRSYVDHINDMGHEYDVSSKEFGFEVSHRGVKLWVPIESVEVEL